MDACARHILHVPSVVSTGGVACVEESGCKKYDVICVECHWRTVLNLSDILIHVRVTICKPSSQAMLKVSTCSFSGASIPVVIYNA